MKTHKYTLDLKRIVYVDTQINFKANQFQKEKSVHDDIDIFVKTTFMPDPSLRDFQNQ